MTAAADSNALGTYLRARREQARPEAAGVPDHRNRRVPGLRREEVAFLAGVSSDYYVRLEQGRDKNPSDQVLLSIARALQLDDEPPPTCCSSPGRAVGAGSAPASRKK
jgi:transcriptional regulator with XRE-family HTH domain